MRKKLKCGHAQYLRYLLSLTMATAWSVSCITLSQTHGAVVHSQVTPDQKNKFGMSCNGPKFMPLVMDLLRTALLTHISLFIMTFWGNCGPWLVASVILISRCLKSSLPYSIYCMAVQRARGSVQADKSPGRLQYGCQRGEWQFG